MPGRTKSHTKLHKDGSLWAKGQTLAGEMHGYWEFYRKDGVKMRSGNFDKGRQTGEWTTYDRNGKVYKLTTMKTPKPKAETAKAK
ncbi:MAG: hypothetical protein Q8R02_12980 [Hyphomonadaceae bacterium]|nr:hypothetical protein [Hyphomonadaceae bacterium]